tara:strand:+ start:652 stop:1638 length:987 start_codon:yes stop_codon:yes gene_type:complete
MCAPNDIKEPLNQIEKVNRAPESLWSDQMIKQLFKDANNNDLWYTGLSAVFNTAAVLIAWSAKTESPKIKLIAQGFISVGMSYSILHGASEYQNAIVYFAASYGFSLMNVWAYALSQQFQQSNDTAVLLCIGVAIVSFIVTYLCDKPMRESAFSIEKMLDNPIVFLRLWKNFWGKARTGAFSMVGSSAFVSLFVENLSFYEPIIFITLFAVLNSQSDNYYLGLPKFHTAFDQFKFLPWLALLSVAASIVFVFDKEIYLKDGSNYNGWLPVLDIVALVIESTGMLFIQPVDKEAKAESLYSEHRYFKLSGDVEETKDINDPKQGPGCPV